MLRITTVAAVSALALAGACGQQVQGPETPSASVEAPVAASASIDNAEFVRQAATTYEFETQAAQLAVERATRPEVKQSAEATLAEVRAASQELANLAPSIGVAAPAAMLSADEQNKLDALRDAETPAFDELYLDQLVEAHNQAVDMFENYVGDAPEGALRVWAQNTLPQMQTRLSQVQGLETAS